MGEIFPFASEKIRIHNPLDVLYHVNPEVGSLAYANKEGILDPHLMPLFARFRELQGDEQRELMREVTKRMGINAHEREVENFIKGSIDLSTIHENGASRRTGLEQSGLTERERIRIQGQNYWADSLGKTIWLEQEGLTERQAIETFGQNYRSDNDVRRAEIFANASKNIQQVKYWANAKIVNDFVGGQKYVSEREAEARELEAKAIQDSLQFAAKLKNEAEIATSKDRLEEAVRGQFLHTQAKIREAEILREKDVEMGYIEQQTILTIANAQLEVEKARVRGLIGSEYYRAVGSSILAGTQALIQTGKGNYKIKASGSNGGFTLEIKIW